MMNNRFYDRLSMLYEKLGISHSDGSSEKGELMAYCNEINALSSELESYFNQIYADIADGLGLSFFCELFKIDSHLNEHEKRQLIRKFLSSKYGDYTYGTMENEIEKLGDDFAMNAENFNVVINGSLNNNFDLLSRLGRIIENYLPPCTVAKFGGDGVDFDFWDSTPYLFEDYDNFNLSFDMLDTLRCSN